MLSQATDADVHDASSMEAALAPDNQATAIAIACSAEIETSTHALSPFVEFSATHGEESTTAGRLIETGPAADRK